jgi:hypothetical protein
MIRVSAGSTKIGGNVKSEFEVSRHSAKAGINFQRFINTLDSGFTGVTTYENIKFEDQEEKADR